VGPPCGAELRAGLEFLDALAREGRVLTHAELRVQAAASGIAQATLWQAVHRRGGVPGWASAVPLTERAQ
jgi:hypothetical protein